MTKTEGAEGEKQNLELDIVWGFEVWADWSDQYPVGGGDMGQWVLWPAIALDTWHVPS